MGYGYLQQIKSEMGEGIQYSVIIKENNQRNSYLEKNSINQLVKIQIEVQRLETSHWLQKDMNMDKITKYPDKSINSHWCNIKGMIYLNT